MVKISKDRKIRRITTTSISSRPIVLLFVCIWITISYAAQAERSKPAEEKKDSTPLEKSFTETLTGKVIDAYESLIYKCALLH